MKSPAKFQHLCAFMALLFLFAAALQHNDPDPLRWAVIYLAASLTSALAACNRLPRPLPLLLMLLAFGWVGYLAPGILQQARYTATEEEREMAGLLLIGAWMLKLYARSPRLTPSTSRS